MLAARGSLWSGAGTGMGSARVLPFATADLSAEAVRGMKKSRRSRSRVAQSRELLPAGHYES